MNVVGLPMVCLLPDTPFGTLPSLDHGIFPRICTFKCLSKSKLLGEMYSSSCDKHHLEKFRVFHGSGQFSRVGSGRVGSGRVGSGRVGSGRVGLGQGDMIEVPQLFSEVPHITSLRSLPKLIRREIKLLTA